MTIETRMLLDAIANITFDEPSNVIVYTEDTYGYAQGYSLMGDNINVFTTFSPDPDDDVTSTVSVYDITGWEMA